jgi:hypothetical protein
VSSRGALERRIAALIAAFEAGEAFDADARDELIEDLAAWQASKIPEYGRLSRRDSWPPALPTDVFRFRRIAVHPASEDRRVFRSSGTTSSERSLHAYRDLRLYDMAARAAARHMLFPDLNRMALVILAPHEDEAPDSSLAYMLTRFADWFGTECTWVWERDTLDLRRLTEALQGAEASGKPVALLGTSFAFVHAEDQLESRFELPPKSRIMHTGGFKGRSRAVDPVTLADLMSTRFGVTPSAIVNEFGATELSSQMYESTLRAARDRSLGPRRLWVPPWVRATPVDPDTLKPVVDGAVGILRIDDTANLDSVCCIQTADLARSIEDGILVLGRAPGATPRGCSLAADQALGPA